MSRKAQSPKGEMAEVVLQPTGIMGDTLCPKCGTRFHTDGYCEQGHMKPTPKPASGEPTDERLREFRGLPPLPATGEWAYNYEEGYWSVTNGTETINGKTFGGPLIGIAMTKESAKALCDTHNAALAAAQATIKQYDDYIKELDDLADK